MKISWQKLAALSLALCLLALALLYPVAPLAPLLAAVLLLPVVLLGLVVVPRSLWPVANLDQRFAAPVLCRADLFQRPPPFGKS
jgi:hypothetical protein